MIRLDPLLSSIAQAGQMARVVLARRSRQARRSFTDATDATAADDSIVIETTHAVEPVADPPHRPPVYPQHERGDREAEGDQPHSDTPSTVDPQMPAAKADSDAAGDGNAKTLHGNHWHGNDQNGNDRHPNGGHGNNRDGNDGTEDRGEDEDGERLRGDATVARRRRTEVAHDCNGVGAVYSADAAIVRHSPQAGGEAAQAADAVRHIDLLG